MRMKISNEVDLVRDKYGPFFIHVPCLSTDRPIDHTTERGYIWFKNGKCDNCKYEVLDKVRFVMKICKFNWERND